MRILQLIKTSVGATWALRQTRQLVSMGVDVHIAIPDGPKVELYREAGVSVHILQTDLPTKQPWKWPALFSELQVLVKHVAPDIVHSHFVGTTLTMRLALKNDPTPRIFQVPGPLHLEHPVYRRGELASAGNQDYWVGSCQWTCDKYVECGIDPARVFLSYYGTDLDAFKPANSGTLRKEFGLSGKKIIGMVAYMYAPKKYLGQTRGLKGHEDLIDAIASCREVDKDVVGVFVGGAWDGATDYEAQVRTYGKARLGNAGLFLGTRKDVASLYPDFDLTVHPSHSENCGGAVESLLMESPTIATNIGGFPDIVKDGETGWLTPASCPTLLARTIEEALSDPEEARKRARAGRKHVAELFDVKNSAASLLEAYRTIISNHER